MKRVFVLVTMILFIVPALAFGQTVIDANTPNRIFPQLVVGGGWKTDITVTNAMSGWTQVSFAFGSQNGFQLAVSVIDGGKIYENCAVINPGTILGKSSRTITLVSSSETPTVGYFVVAIPKNSRGEDTAQVSVQYSYAPNGVIVGQAAVNPVEPIKSFGFYASSSKELRTGLAVANFNALPAHLVFNIRNVQGGEITSFQMTIPQGGQVAKFISEFATSLTTLFTGGLVEVTSDVPVTPMTLQVTSNGVFSTGTTFPLPN